MIQTKAPGKLMLTGEWSILTPGNSCISLALNRYAYVTGIQSSKWILNSSLFNDTINFHWSYQHGISLEKPITAPLAFSLAALTTTFTFLTESNHQLPSPHSITITSHELYDPNTRIKFGFGSSAATTAALPFRIVDVVRDTALSDGTFQQILVTFNFGLHFYRQATGI